MFKMWYMCFCDIRWQSASQMPPQMFVTMFAKKRTKCYHKKHVPKFLISVHRGRKEPLKFKA